MFKTRQLLNQLRNIFTKRKVHVNVNRSEKSMSDDLGGVSI